MIRRSAIHAAGADEHRAAMAAAIESARNPKPAQDMRVSPRHGYRKFDGAVVDRLTSSWFSYNVALDNDLRTSLDRLRARSRDLFKNNEFAVKFGHMVRNNVVGSEGFVLQAQPKKPDGTIDDADENAIEQAWRQWCKPTECDAAGRRSFVDVCKAAILSVVRDGEFLIRKRRGPGVGTFGYQLQLLDVDRLDTLLNLPPADGRNAIIMGVELDDYRRPVAYHLWDRHPLDDAHVATRYRERVPASEIIHGFIPIEDEQVRGVPWLHAVMRRLNDLNGYREAAVVASRIGASKMGFFEGPEDGPGMATDGQDDEGNFVSAAEPGTFEKLPPGYTFNTFNPDYPHQQFEMFCKATLAGIASGLNVSYPTLANDPAAVNFSTIRAFVIEERDHWMGIQNWLINALLETVFADWLLSALGLQQIIGAGNSPLPLNKMAKFREHGWRPRRWQWVDPLKDMAANVLAIENGLDSPQRIAAQQGRDVEDIVEDLRRFRDLLKEKGVELVPQKTPTGTVSTAVAGSGTDSGGAAENTDAKAAGTDSGRALQRLLEIVERMDAAEIESALKK